MGKPTGFLEIERRERGYDKPAERLKTWREFTHPLPDAELARQAARCMGCGIPFCHQGCPVNNQIPDWNDLVYRDQWRAALENLHSTNNFPEFTGRVCPAPCEAACTLNIDDNPVTIKTIECQIVDRGWAEGWIEPQVKPSPTGRRVAVVGSGPAGLACAQQLARAGHAVVAVREERPDRRPAALRHPRLQDGEAPHRPPHGADGGRRRHLPPRRRGRQGRRGRAICSASYDAVVLSGGAEDPRDLPAARPRAGRHPFRDGFPHPAEQARWPATARRSPRRGGTITAKGKHVVVIGGGDTGSDCIGTSNRQGAASVTQLEIMPMPPERENKALTWPDWPLKLRTSSSHEEGVRPRLRGRPPCALVGKDRVRGARVRPRRVGAGRRTAARR